MVTYTPTQLAIRKSIIDSHVLLIEFLKINGINNLLHLFDPIVYKNMDPNEKITKYVEKERKLRGLDT